MLISNKNILFSFLLILSAFFFSFSYNFETYSLIEATIQSGLINYPDEFNLHQIINMNSWSLPIQIISILVKKNHRDFSVVLQDPPGHLNIRKLHSFI